MSANNFQSEPQQPVIQQVRYGRLRQLIGEYAELPGDARAGGHQAQRPSCPHRHHTRRRCFPATCTLYR